MNLIFENFMARDKSIIDLKNSFRKSKSKLILTTFGVWVVISLILAFMQPNKYASYITDLPDNLKNISPLILSLAYLVLFLPAVTVTILFTIYFLYDIVKDRMFK